MTAAAFVLKYIYLCGSIRISTYTCAPLGYIDAKYGFRVSSCTLQKTSVGFVISGVILSFVHLNQVSRGRALHMLAGISKGFHTDQCWRDA